MTLEEVLIAAGDGSSGISGKGIAILVVIAAILIWAGSSGGGRGR